MIFLYIGLLLLSFYLLAVIVEEFFVPSLEKISTLLKLSPDIAGATFMAVGSSAPELFVSFFALIRPSGAHANVGAGTIVGSAIFNILVIIGISASIKTAKLTWQPVLRDLLFYCTSILLLLFSFWDGQFTLLEAGMFVGTYLVYIFAVFKWKDWFAYSQEEITLSDKSEKSRGLHHRVTAVLRYTIPSVSSSSYAFFGTFFASVVWIAALSYLLVESGVIIGELLHINPTIIALTILASGTSIPDLLSSMIVAKRGYGDMAVSNAIGSNIFDILFGLGFPWVLILFFTKSPIIVETENLIGSVVLLFATVVAILFLLIIRNWKIGRRAGLVLVFLYLLYLAYNIYLTLAV